MDIGSFLRAAAKIAQAGLAHAPEIIEVVRGAASLIPAKDQATAQAAIADLQADNDEGFARLDAKLAEAEKR